MTGHIHALYRHPVKGFTPERVARVAVAAGEYFPNDRLFAVENGPSGFDPDAPVHISKSRFTVLAQIAEVASVRTRFDEANQVFHAEAPDHPPIVAALNEEAGRAAFAAWLERVLPSDSLRGALKVVSTPGHRFMDHPQGFVSVLNLASVRDLAARIGRLVDPLRFRANVLVEGWAPWAELDHAPGAGMHLGAARCEVFKPIVRCVATHVDPTSAKRDMDVVEALRTHYGHLYCGVYVSVTHAGALMDGDKAEFVDD